MIKYQKKIVLMLLSLLCAQNALGHIQESSISMVFNRILGASVGGGIGYLLARVVCSQTKTQHENQIKFLEDLKQYVLTADYISKRELDRMFSHYYQGLVQLVQMTRDADIALLNEFSQQHDTQSVKKLVIMIENVQSRLQASHEKSLFLESVFIATFGAIIGGYLVWQNNSSECSHGCSHARHHLMAPISLHTKPNNFFQSR